ncbi:MAG: hypothetical protein ABI760_01460 [Ferruginibacter sp.]
MTTISIHQLPMQRLTGGQSLCKRFDRHMSNLYPGIRPWNEQTQAQ